MSKYQSEAMEINDSRLSLIREVFQGIKYIKLTATEERYKTDIQTIRGNQEKKIFGVLMSVNLFFVFNQIAPLLMPVATFVLYGKVLKYLLYSIRCANI
jgi:hypothetical protein